MWSTIPESIKELYELFKEQNKSIFLVGGCVRDFLIGSLPKDWDLATDSLPDETIAFLSGKYKLDLVGKSFGIIIIHLIDMKVELATFRTDLYETMEEFEKFLTENHSEKYKEFIEKMK